MSKETKIENAIINSTTLGIEDHGVLTYFLHLKGNGWGCGFGGFILDEKPEDARGYCSRAIRGVLEALEVHSWEKLPGTIIRAEVEGWGGGIVRIGHAIKDKWFSLKELSKELKELSKEVDGDIV